MNFDAVLESLETKRQMSLLADIMRSEKRPHILPLRMHDQEKNYSPALKKTGGYSSKPPLNEERISDEMANRYPLPDFLWDAPKPPGDGEQEPNWWEMIPVEEPPKPQDKKNDRNCVKDGGVWKCQIPGTNRWITADGRSTPPPKGF